MEKRLLSHEQMVQECTDLRQQFQTKLSQIANLNKQLDQKNKLLDTAYTDIVLLNQTSQGLDIGKQEQE